MTAPRRARHLASVPATDPTAVPTTGPADESARPAAADPASPPTAAPPTAAQPTTPYPAAAPEQPPSIVATGLGVRYHRRWALQDCTFQLPVGAVAAVVGRNGAGKSTLLRLLAGLDRPGAGSLTVLGNSPWRPGSARVAEIGYVGQDRPMYGGLRVREMLTLGRRLNPHWDQQYANDRLIDRGIPLDKRVARLSGGQRTQLALTMALAKRPSLLILDEPLSDLDPLARREVMSTVLIELAERNVTVILSSHSLADLGRACDHLLLIDAGRLLLADQLDALVARHDIVTGPADQAARVMNRCAVVAAHRNGRQVVMLVVDQPGLRLDDRWTHRRPTVEDIVFAYQGHEPGAS